MKKRNLKRVLRAQMRRYRALNDAYLALREETSTVSYHVVEIRLGENSLGRPMVVSIAVDPRESRSSVDLPAMGYDVTQRGAPEDLPDFRNAARPRFVAIGQPTFDMLMGMPPPQDVDGRYHPAPPQVDHVDPERPGRFDFRDPATRMREHDETLQQTYDRLTANDIDARREERRADDQC